MTHFIPKNFRFSAIYSGIKRDKSREDLALVVSDTPCVAAGVYTQNLVCAAPVVVDRKRTPSKNIRAVVVNSGNANACTGERGIQDAEAMIRIAAECVGAEADAALVMSTGIIGHFLPMDVVERGIQEAAKLLSADESAMVKAARGLMTTDTTLKLFSRQVMVAGVPVHIAVMGKGSGMIGPNMATFLGMVLTDAFLTPESAQALLQKVADRTINCVTVDGHTSTNDTLLMLANGAAYSLAAGNESQRSDRIAPPNDSPLLSGHSRCASFPAVMIPDAAESPEFCAAVMELCTELARAIADDGEGASHLVTINVRGLRETSEARKIAKAIAESPLVKCAFTGNDPNWGRIVSAAGYTGVPFDVTGVSLRMNGFTLFQNGTPAEFDAAAVSASMKANREIVVELSFTEGDADACVWTCDLTTEYVHINADYHT